MPPPEGSMLYAVRRIHGCGHGLLFCEMALTRERIGHRGLPPVGTIGAEHLRHCLVWFLVPALPLRVAPMESQPLAPETHLLGHPLLDGLVLYGIRIHSRKMFNTLANHRQLCGCYRQLHCRVVRPSHQVGNPCIVWFPCHSGTDFHPQGENTSSQSQHRPRQNQIHYPRPQAQGKPRGRANRSGGSRSSRTYTEPTANPTDTRSGNS